jgi:hypothetical protein
MDIVGACKEEGFTFEELEVPDQVIDHIIRLHQAFIAAKAVLAPGKEGEIVLQPADFVHQGIGEFHSGGDDVYFIFFIEFCNHPLGIRVYGQVTKESGGIEILMNDPFVFRRNGFGE